MSPFFPSDLVLPTLLACGWFGPSAPDGAAPPPAAPAEAPAADAGGSVLVLLRGTVDADGRFTGCDGAVVPFADVAGLKTRVASALGVPEVPGATYVELRAVRRVDGSHLARAVDVAQVEGPGCGLTLAPGTLRAFGNEPFWSAELRGTELVVSRMDQPELTLTVHATVSTGQRRSWRGTLDGGDEVLLVALRQRCADTMATASYPFTATLTVGAWTGTGCARTAAP